MSNKIRAIVTGATGMVGEGVLLECLANDNVETVLIINRRPSGHVHPKLKEIVHKDFYNLTPIADQLKGYNACYFCLGISSVGVNEADYTKQTYTLTMHVAEVLSKQNPDMVFCYVSGGGTDSTEKGRTMWARVKGKTENELMKLPFKDVYAFRPGAMKPTAGQKYVLSAYKYVGWLYPVIRAVGYATTIKEVGEAMINATLKGYSKKVIEIKDIITLAKM